METILGQARQVGNSSGVLLPKDWLNRKVVVTLAEPSEKEILQDMMKILYDEKILENVLGIYLLGSHARGGKEITKESDIDILVIIDDEGKGRTIENGNYQINIVREQALLKSIEEMPFHYYPMIYEARPLLNMKLLEKYRNLKIDLKSSFIKDTRKSLKESKKIISLDKKLGNNKTSDAVAYSLVLRLRGFYIINKILKKHLWKKSEFCDLIKRITGSLDVYNRYLHIKKKGRGADNSIKIEDAKKIIDYLEEGISKWEKHEKKKRIKRLEKQIEGLEEQRKKHVEKLEKGKFREDYRKDTTPEYWGTEIEQLRRKIEEKRALLEKLQGKQKSEKFN